MGTPRSKNCHISSSVSKWQIHAAFWGVMLWFSSFRIYESVKMPEMSTMAAGYMIGFFVAFSGYLTLRIISERGISFLNLREGAIWGVAGSLSLVAIILIGVAGFYNEIFGVTAWTYNIGFFLSCLVMSKAVLPVITWLDA
jgi:hypothetical protein